MRSGSSTAATPLWFTHSCRTGSRTRVAGELTAETFAQAALSLKRFRDEMDGSGLPWLYGIARNLLRTYHERERIESKARQRLGLPARDYELEVHEAEARVDAERLAPELSAALATLPRTQRQALELRVDAAASVQTGRALARLLRSRSAHPRHARHRLSFPATERSLVMTTDLEAIGRDLQYALERRSTARGAVEPSGPAGVALPGNHRNLRDRRLRERNRRRPPARPEKWAILGGGSVDDNRGAYVHAKNREDGSNSDLHG